MSKTYDAAELVNRLRVKYGDHLKGWALLEQVAATSGHNDGYSDAIAVQLWPSRGIELVGFEIKVSRGDWLRELRQRKKVEYSAFVFCDRWWVVANQGCVHEGELPSLWGLLEPRGRGLTVITPAPPLEPQQIDRSFLAAVLRRAAKAGEFDRQSLIREATKAGRSEAKEHAEQRVKWVRDDLDRLRKRVAGFEEASGVKMDSYPGGAAIGHAVRAVLDGTGEGTLIFLRDRLESQIKSLDVALAGIRGETDGAGAD